MIDGLSENARMKMKLMREKKKIKVSVLCDVLGYESEKGYYDLESGRIDLKINHLGKLSNFYQKPISYFFSNDCTEKVHISKKCTDEENV